MTQRNCSRNWTNSSRDGTHSRLENNEIILSHGLTVNQPDSLLLSCDCNCGKHPRLLKNESGARIESDL